MGTWSAGAGVLAASWSAWSSPVAERVRVAFGLALPAHQTGLHRVLGGLSALIAVARDRAGVSPLIVLGAAPLATPGNTASADRARVTSCGRDDLRGWRVVLLWHGHFSWNGVSSPNKDYSSLRGCRQGSVPPLPKTGHGRRVGGAGAGYQLLSVASALVGCLVRVSGSSASSSGLTPQP